MANEKNKQELLQELVDAGFIPDVDSYKNLSVPQINFFLGKANASKDANPVSGPKEQADPEKEIDDLASNENLESRFREQLSAEIVKRRNAEQKLSQVRAQVRSKLDSFVEILK